MVIPARPARCPGLARLDGSTGRSRRRRIATTGEREVGSIACCGLHQCDV